MLCVQWIKDYGLTCFVLRIFTVYGTGQRGEFLIPYLIHCAMNGKRVRIKHLEAVCNYVHVNDVVEAVIASIKSEREDCVYNVGSGEGISVVQVVKDISNICNKEIIIETPSQATNDTIPCMVASNSFASEILGWFLPR